jgi:hypothetical protein
MITVPEQLNLHLANGRCVTVKDVEVSAIVNLAGSIQG